MKKLQLEVNFNIMDKDKWLGVGLIFAGLFFLRWTIKTWDKERDIFNTNASGLIGTIGSIVGGIAFLLGKVHW